MNKRTAQKVNTRTIILDTAFQLFAEQGFLKVSTLAIAEKAGISHGSVFSHFKNRDDLIEEVIARFGQNTVRRMHELAESHESLRTVLEAHLESIRENESFYSHLIRELPVLPRTTLLSVTAIQSGVSYHISMAAEAELKVSVIRSIAPDLLFTTWIGLIHHYLMNRELFITDASISIIETYGIKLLAHFLKLISN